MSDKLIVRLASRGQYEIDVDREELLAELNQIDNRIVALLSRTEREMQKLLDEMANQVRARGKTVDDTLTGSDLILPPPDLTLAEAAELFRGEGVIPG
ncbi:MAG: hypothetical protein P8186_29010 [Anaerolineae bacterium]|jgi:hypothetical protein